MSGIAGIFNPTGLRENSKQDLTGMLAAMRHRGPDGTHIYKDEELGLAIGQAYLDINSGITGPNGSVFTDKDGGRVMTANARFYDFKEVRTRLRFEGAAVDSKNDHAIVLPLYDRYGLDFTDHLRGEFAISLLDTKRQQLYLIRDRFGVKPLFYAIKEGTVYWASEIKGLFAHPAIDAKFSTTGLLHQLMHTMVPGTSAFEGIYSVKPGQIVIVDYQSGQ